MSSVPHSEDAASPHLTKSSTEEQDHEKNDIECEICRVLRLPDPVYFSVEYRDLKKAAGKGCGLCDLLQKVSETAASTVRKSIWEHNRIRVTPRGRGVLERDVLENAPRLNLTLEGTLEGTAMDPDPGTSQLAHRTNAIQPLLLTTQPLTDSSIFHPVRTFLSPKRKSPQNCEYRVDVL